jgi:hypothetical protein
MTGLVVFCDAEAAKEGAREGEDEGKGSETNARSDGWFWTLFLLRFHEDMTKLFASEEESVAVGNGRDVDTVREYMDARSSAVVRPETASGATMIKAAKTERIVCIEERNETLARRGLYLIMYRLCLWFRKGVRFPSAAVFTIAPKSMTDTTVASTPPPSV